MKKLLSLFLAVVFAAGALLAAPVQLPNFAVSASAAVEQEIPVGPDYDAASFLTYSLSPDSNEYYVSGYNGEACDELVIPAEYEGKPVTKIRDSAFTLNLNIKAVKLPDTITEIGREAFTNSSIEEIIISDSVTSIGEYAFRFCYKLKKVVLSKNLTVIEANAFNGCTELTDITFYEGLETIGDYAFNSCTSLEKITFPNSLTTIGTRAFAGCTTLQEVTIPGNVKSVMEHAFGDCSGIKKLTLLDGAQCDSSAFEGCINLEKIDLPNTHVYFAAENF